MQKQPAIALSPFRYHSTGNSRSGHFNRSFVNRDSDGHLSLYKAKIRGVDPAVAEGTCFGAPSSNTDQKPFRDRLFESDRAVRKCSVCRFFIPQTRRCNLHVELDETPGAVHLISAFTVYVTRPYHCSVTLRFPKRLSWNWLVTIQWRLAGVIRTSDAKRSRERWMRCQLYKGALKPRNQWRLVPLD
jgi:hypothetical protein